MDWRLLFILDDTIEYSIVNSYLRENKYIFSTFPETADSFG